MDSNASREYDEQGYQGWNPRGGYPAWDDGIEKDVFVKWPIELQHKHDQNGTVPGRPDILLGNVSSNKEYLAVHHILSYMYIILSWYSVII